MPATNFAMSSVRHCCKALALSQIDRLELAACELDSSVLSCAGLAGTQFLTRPCHPSPCGGGVLQSRHITALSKLLPSSHRRAAERCTAPQCRNAGSLGLPLEQQPPVVQLPAQMVGQDRTGQSSS